ncbi:MAG: hypothetical protein AAF725_25555 [Acidobacteriota bacterium]
MRNLVATGRRTLQAFGRETGWQRGGPSVLAHDPVLPSGGRIRRTTMESLAVNRRGLKTRGTPGSVEGAYTFEGLLTASLCLDFGYAVLGSVEKTALSPGLWRYDFEDAGDEHADVSFWGFGGLPPQYRQQLFGIRFADWETAVEVNKQSTLKATGTATHGTRIGPAEPEATNLGSSTPRVRGRLRDAQRGDLFIRVAQDLAGGGLVFEVETSSGAPAWAGAFLYAAVLDEEGDHVWQNLRDQDGLDVGAWDESKDLCEIYLGTAAELADYAVGDVFRFPAPGSWPTPALVTAGGAVMVNAHYQVRFRRQGSAGPWQEIDRTSATYKTMVALHENRGKPSHYIATMLHVGEYEHTLQVVRDYTDATFDDLYESGSGVNLLEVEHGHVGRLLDPVSEIRESILWTLPAMEIMSLDSPAQNAGAVSETVDLIARPDPAGGAPIRLRVITDVDWTPDAI